MQKKVGSARSTLCEELGIKSAQILMDTINIYQVVEHSILHLRISLTVSYSNFDVSAQKTLPTKSCSTRATKIVLILPEILINSFIVCWATKAVPKSSATPKLSCHI